jgi:hypothetical protein
LKKKKKSHNEGPGMVVHACDPSIWEKESGGSQVGSQLELHRETLYQKMNTTMRYFISSTRGRGRERKRKRRKREGGDGGKRRKMKKEQEEVK